MPRFVTALIFSVALSGCAYYQPVPADVRMPVAVLKDSGIVESKGKAQFFAAEKIDGKTIYNAFNASAQASHGDGFALTPVLPWREIPIRPMRIELRAGHATGAPIHALASTLAGTYHSVKGTIEFEPLEGHDYIVKGELGEQSAVWIEDEKTGERVSAIVTNR